MCVGTAGIVNDGDTANAPHVWVMTRESTSKDTVEASEDEAIVEKGGIKFWEVTSGTLKKRKEEGYI